MALRNIKITRDIVQTCNKTRAFTKPDFCPAPSQQQAECPENASKYHSMSYSTKSECNYPKNILSELNTTEKNMASPVKQLRNDSQLSTIYTQKGTTDIHNNRFFIPARSYATKKGGKEDDCSKVEKKCYKDVACPKFRIAGCPPMKASKSECPREYIEPCCTKKMAPYPSYSELCAYRLENDPSECKQCPWQRCSGAQDIKPQKKGYHTSARAMNMAMIPSKGSDMTPFFLQKECDAKKDPCKEPPPRCKKEEKTKEECPPKKEKDKNKCAPNQVSPQAWTISGSIRNLDLQRDLPSVIAREHDKGHPPPCDDKRKPKSEECPQPSKKKKMYRQESDLYDPAYRKHPNPYNDES